MVGSCKVEDIGKVKECELCGEEFTAGRPCDGKTFKFCPKCSFAVNSKNYLLLTPGQKEINSRYNKSHGRVEYARRNIDRILSWNRQWRRDNPSKRYAQKKREVQRYTDETLSYASNHGMPWDSSDVEYLREKGKQRTARDLALDLGRTYLAVVVEACKEGIPLLTEDKKHGRLVTTR